MRPTCIQYFMTVAALIGFAPNADAIDARVTAVGGAPYGVATIEIPNDQQVIGQELPPLQAIESSGRVLFPSSDSVRIEVLSTSERRVPQPGRGRLLKRIGGLIREIAGDEEKQYRTVARRVSFLFVGKDPIRLQIADARGEIGTYDIEPESDPSAHRQLLNRWWTAYTDGAKSQIDVADYPVLVEIYLVAMLAGRLQLPLPDWYADTEDDDELISTLKLIGGAKATSETIFRRTAAGSAGSVSASSADASLPLPNPPNWSPMFTAEGLDEIPVEPMATRVPSDCFYLRYGSFENYIWFRDLSNEYGGDITRMVTLRGIANDSFARLESQLNVKTTELSRMLGPQVIEDQAIIGRDMFMEDGASIGVMFKSKSPFLLRTSVSGERSKRAREDDSITLETVKIGDHDVSFLSSADNRVRSFLAEDGEYFLITNSRTLAQRFFEVGESGDSLASTPAFQLSRKLMPLERNDTIFVYLSPAMLRGLVSPQYMIELRRRLQAKSEIAMVHLARLAAAQEGGDPDSGVDELIASGFLPQDFGTRADGGGVISVGDQMMDTLRGARGSFLPIADTKIDLVTAEEARWYAGIADHYSENFPTIDPIMIGIGREAVENIEDVEGLERISIHAEIAPWSPEKYGPWAQQLGPPTNVAMQFAPDDIIAMQAHVASPQLGPPTHLFAAIKDTVPPDPDDFDGLLNIYRSLRGLPGYLGAWPQPGALDRLPLGLGQGRPVGPGLSRLIGGLYRYTDGEFSVLSFQPKVIETSLPFLGSVEVEDSAQIRVRIGNLKGSQIEGWANAQLYERSRSGSVAGANFLSLLTRQLSVDPVVAAESAKQVLGAELQCTLGGEYEFSEPLGRWVSGVWNGDVAEEAAPPDYVAPAMKWFRGASATVTQYEDRVVADLTVDVARQ